MGGNYAGSCSRMVCCPIIIRKMIVKPVLVKDHLKYACLK